MKVGGQVRVPGDKSITHRALLLGAMARGGSHIGGALTSLDALERLLKRRFFQEPEPETVSQLATE